MSERICKEHSMLRCGSCEEIESLKKENEQMKEVLISIAFLEEPMADDYSYWQSIEDKSKFPDTLANDTYLARECLAKLGER